MPEDILYRSGRVGEDQEGVIQLVLPQKYRNEAMEFCHDKMGHFRKERMLALLRDRFYWMGMETDVEAYLNRCARCLRFQGLPDKAPLQPYTATGPMDLIHMDFLKLDKCKGGFESVLMITDHYTHYAQAYATRNETAVTMAKVFWHQWVPHYGWPNHIITDKGQTFLSVMMMELCKLGDVKKINTTPYHPQTNGQVERYNRTLIAMLGKLEPDDKKDWKIVLPAMCHAYNSTSHSTTGYSPYYLMFGREPRLAVDVRFGTKRPGVKSWEPHSIFIEKTKKRMDWAFKQSEAWHRKRGERAKRNYDKRTRGAKLKVGDIVLVRRMAFEGRHKLADRWEAPEYIVIEVPWEEGPIYKIKRVDGTGKVHVLHRNQLLPLSMVETDRMEAEAETERCRVHGEVRQMEDQGLQQRSVATPKGVDAATVRQTDRTVERREMGDVPGPSPPSERNRMHPPLNVAGPLTVSDNRTDSRTEQKQKKPRLSRVPDLVDDGKKRTLV
jgi:transposase InsO family protein